MRCPHCAESKRRWSRQEKEARRLVARGPKLRRRCSCNRPLETLTAQQMGVCALCFPGHTAPSCVEGHAACASSAMREVR